MEGPRVEDLVRRKVCHSSQLAPAKLGGGWREREGVKEGGLGSLDVEVPERCWVPEDKTGEGADGGLGGGRDSTPVEVEVEQRI